MPIFASTPAGVDEADDASSGANEDIEYVETELVGQRGRPVGHVHERVDFRVEHFHPDPYVRGILDQGFKVPVDWLHTFPDGRHLGGVFKSFKQLKARKVPKFYSYAFSANSSGVDAFSMSWEGERASYCAPPIALILRTIRKIEVSKMTGVLLIPLWRGARFWLHAFLDGRHLGGVFKSFKQLQARTRSWGVSPKDAFAGKWVVFLALEIDSRGDGGSLESVVSHSRCFGRLFGHDCAC
jgi:hypothetical protein